MRKPPPGIPNELLKYAREKQGWSQQELADRIDPHKASKNVVTVKTIQRWEQGKSAPTQDHLSQLQKLFNKSPAALGYPGEGKISFWRVPRQNDFFTGRETILQQLHDIFQLQRAGPSARGRPVALSGLGGIGKSQIALEYAYRYRNYYHAVVWIQATSSQQFVSDLAALAHLLELPEYDTADSRVQMSAVKTWFSELTRWLLIFDNAEDFGAIERFLPSESHGHVLLTTQAQTTGKFADCIAVESLDDTTGAELLLRRADHIPLKGTVADATAVDVADAHSLSEELGGLPLALDQAGAYIEETGASLSEYLRLYQHEQAKLLAARGAIASEESGHPDSVVITVSLSVGKADKQHPLTRDILNFCTFLQSDAIPEELFQSDGGFQFGTTVFHEGIAALLRYSLIKRHTEENFLSMHRLVQAVLQDTLGNEEKQLWIERAVRAVNASFPDLEFGGTWPQRDWPACERLVRHGVQLALSRERVQLVSPEAGELLHKTALYLWNRRDFSDVESLYQQALQVRRQLFGTQHPDVAASLNSLANLYYEQGRYNEAEALYQQALRMRECLLGSDHPDLVPSLNGLAKLCYYAKADHTRAEALYQQAIRLTEGHLGVDHPYRAYLLMNLANLYSSQEQYQPAEACYRSAIHIWEQHLGPNHPSTALAYNNLGALYLRKRDYTQAEACFLRTRQLLEGLRGRTHPYIVPALNNLAEVYMLQGKYTEAEPLYHQALQLLEAQLGLEDSNLAYPLSGLGELYRLQGRYEASLHSYKRALRLRKKAFGLQHPSTAEIMDGLGQLQEAQGCYEKARILYAGVRAIREQVFGLSHSSTRETSQRLIALLHTMGQHDEATQLEATLQLPFSG